jgi:hypothetical protein
MNRALLYLWLALLKRRTLRFCCDLRRPTKLIGLAALMSLVGFLFYYREHDIFVQLTRRETIIGCALVMLGGSLFKGFLQRGLVFEPADIEFLFTGPFTQRQVVFYRLLPNYLFALIQGLVFLGLFTPHLKHPLLTTAGFIFFQLVCFHLATAMSLFAGSISAQLHHRIRWMLLAVYFLSAAACFRAAWDIKIIPSFVSSPFTQLLFYPAVTLSDVGMAPPMHEWARRLMETDSLSRHQLWQPVSYLAGSVVSALVSLWLLFKLKADAFETSLTATTRMAERRLRVQQGRRVAVIGKTRWRSASLPTLRLFRGVGAIVWKNLVVARRSRRELGLALIFTAVFAVPLAALLWLLHDLMARGGQVPPREVEGFHAGIVLFVALLPFLLQRMFPFDFRADGHHLVGFRTLPVSPFALAFAEIAVPAGLCLAFQAVAIGILMTFGRFEWALLFLMVLVYPAVALAVNGVWNLHYLLDATRRAAGSAASSSAVGTLMVVALSFLIFLPAGWTAVQIFDTNLGFTLGAVGFVAVQYPVDFLLVLALAKLFQRFEASRDFQ